uniref:Uncharacterized protein n=1 Tax=Rhizophora mucronata TaxID=61149 RepID=A0A2P2QE83_RHIMU
MYKFPSRIVLPFTIYRLLQGNCRNSSSQFLGF